MIWYRMRAFRVTASNFKDVCRTSLEHTSFSLIKRIRYPEKYIFTNSALKYGRDNESVARYKYALKMSTLHANFKFIDSGRLKLSGNHFDSREFFLLTI